MTTKEVIWPQAFSPTEWPIAALQYMDAKLFTDGLFPLREMAGVAMWPSALFGAHVRHEGKSRHSTQVYTRLSDATDMHVDSIEDMLIVMECAERIPAIGGIGIYFNTNTPMVHIDMRPNRLVWIRTQDGEYVYKCNDIVRFYLVLARQLSL